MDRFERPLSVEKQPQVSRKYWQERLGLKITNLVKSYSHQGQSVEDAYVNLSSYFSIYFDRLQTGHLEKDTSTAQMELHMAFNDMLYLFNRIYGGKSGTGGFSSKIAVFPTDYSRAVSLQKFECRTLNEILFIISQEVRTTTFNGFIYNSVPAFQEVSLVSFEPQPEVISYSQVGIRQCFGEEYGELQQLFDVIQKQELLDYIPDTVDWNEINVQGLNMRNGVS